MKRPKLTFVMTSFIIGGAERQWTQYLSQRPQNPDWDIEIITLMPAKAESIEQSFIDSGVKTLLIDRTTTSFPLFLWKLFREIQTRKPDIVHTVLDGSTATWGRLCALLAGVPIIMHSDRNLKSPMVTPLQNRLRPYLDRFTARFLPNAQAIADMLVDKGIPANKVFVMPNSTNIERFDPETTASLRDKWGIAQEASVAGYLGAFRKAKRLDLLLEAMLLVPEEKRPDYLVMAGTGQEMDDIKSRIDKSDWLKSHCLLLGSIDNTPEFLKSIDYLMLMSDFEGLPNVVLEAMAMEKPVVATAVSDVPTLIEGAGILVEAGNPQSMAEGMEKMFTMPELERKALGAFGRQKVQDNYEISKSNATFWQHHADVMQAKGRL
ncbi:MAG: glycosyltransferase [Trueperaceae bacterium]|nr:glycosyltransferase [Trueperaceae bacterium]